MSVRRQACAAFKRSVIERVEADARAKREANLRHYDGARATMEQRFNLSDAGPGSAWAYAPASFVPHTRTVRQWPRGTTQVTQPAVEFLVEGLRFRVTESPRYLSSATFPREQQDGWTYTVYVHLPEAERPWYRRWRKPRWYWMQVSTQEVLGALLTERKMCSPCD